jgi:hypothetical protein
MHRSRFRSVAFHPPRPVLNIFLLVAHLAGYLFRRRIVAVLVDLGVPVQSRRFAAVWAPVLPLNPVKVPALVHRRKPVDVVGCFGAERTAAFLAGVIFFLPGRRMRFFISLIIFFHIIKMSQCRFIGDRSAGIHIGQIASCMLPVWHHEYTDRHLPRRMMIFIGCASQPLPGICLGSTWTART